MRFVNRRMYWSRAVLGVALALSVALESPYLARSALEHGYAHESLSLLLVVIAALGRVWTTIYLGGRKNSQLVTDGPFSICRNPLYLFSGVGILGIAIQSHQPWAALLLFIFILVVYSRTIRNEERHLAGRFGEAYSDYCRATPRLIPNIVLYRDEEEIVVRPRFVLKAIADNIWWIVAWYLLGVVERLRMLWG